MDIRNTLDMLIEAGVCLRVADGELTVEVSTPLTRAERQLIREGKDELVNLLSTPTRLWTIQEPSGATWLSSFTPPQTQAEVLAMYPAGITATPAATSEEADHEPETFHNAA